MDDNRSKVILESLRQSEEMMKSQMTIALASDARALTFCGVVLAAASLLVGLAESSGLPVAMYSAGGLLYVSSALAGWTAMPVAWFAAGQKGGDFKDDIEQNKPFDDVALEMVAYNDTQIDKNETVRKRQGRWLRRAAWTAVSAAPIGLVCQALVWLSR